MMSRYGDLARRWVLVWITLISLLLATDAMARRIPGGLPGGVLVPPATLPNPALPPQFDVTGYLETASVDPTMCPNLDPRLWGGHVRINGQQFTIPCNTILQMPAFAMSWSDFVKKAPADQVNNTGAANTWKSGLALGDTFSAGAPGLLDTPWTPPAGLPGQYNAKLPAHEFHVIGNTIGGVNIVGLMFVSQQSLNAGQGQISCIDYATGELQVGGTLLPHGSPCPAPDGTFTRVRLNDPKGRFGIVHGNPTDPAGSYDVAEPGYDARYTADTDNPTISSQLGYPVCVPAFNPFATTKDPITGAPLPATIDAMCPIYNRPVAPNCKSFDPATLLPPFGPQPDGTYCQIFVMDPPGAHALNFAATDPMAAAPLVIGDTIIFHGTMKADAKGPYISAHTIEANLGIYTTPHVPPSYVRIEALGVGTGGGTVGGVAIESTIRVFWVGFATDPTELVDFYSLHQDPTTGATTAYLQGTFDTCCVPLGRTRSPVNNIGVFGEPQRNYRAVSRTACQTTPPSPQIQTRCMMDPPAIPDPTAVQATPIVNLNGLTTGQFSLPNFEFIFGENLAIGGGIIPANLQDLPFLFCGSGPLDGPGTASPVVGQLYPPPWAQPMADPAYHFTGQYPGCENAPSVGAAAAPTTTPLAKLPAVLNSVTATPAIANLGATTTVTLVANATNPNTPALGMSYAWTFTAPKGVAVSMSCGTCAANANSRTVTATITAAATATPGPIVFTATVSNGVLPNPSGTANVLVPGVNPPNQPKVTGPSTVPGGSLVTLTATSATNPAGGAVTFTFRQVATDPNNPAATPLIYLNQQPVPKLTPLPVTTVNNQTATTSFYAPLIPAGGNIVIQVFATDAASGVVSKPFPLTIKVNPFTTDAVGVTSVAYRQIVSRVGAPAEFGKFTVVATSNADFAPPPGWTMNATITATLANGTLSQPVVVPMLLTPADAPGTLTPTCGAAPCWVGNINTVITDATVTPSILVAPDTVTVKSSLGGAQTVLKGNPIYVIR